MRIAQNEYLLMWRSDGETYAATVDSGGKPVKQARQIPDVTLNANDVLRYNPVTGLVHWAVPGADGTSVRLYAYDPGKEINVTVKSDTGGSRPAAPTSSSVKVNGKQVDFDAYNIDGNNYFKLRDIGRAFNFSVGWDGAANTITIDTDKPYTD